MTGLAIPADAAAITASWLTAVLATAGFDVEVGSVTSEPVGTGQMARSERFHLTYTRGDGPASLVAKFAASDPTSRASGAAGGYPNEVNFYRHLASTVRIRRPACHYVDMAADGSEFVVLLEDMAPARQGDQIAGCSVDEAIAAAVNLAGLHAPRWNDPALNDLPWIMKRSPEGAEFMRALMVGDTAGFVERYRTRLSAEEAGVLSRFADRSDRWTMGRAEPFAVIHGDYRLDNLLFDSASERVTVAAVDWQTVAVGLPAKDLAYLLGNGLPVEVRRAHEREIVAAYHAALVDGGVRGYGLDQCWDDYVYGQFHGLVVTVLGAMRVVQTDRGDDMFMAMASRHCAAISDLDAERYLAV